MKKRNHFIRNTLLFLCLVLCFAASVSAADGFQAKRSYADAGFGDVATDAWYYKDVKSAYELSLINGMGEGVFAPDSTMTVAQGITLAVRMNAAYNGKPEPQQTAVWYEAYVTYALENGIVSEGQLNEINRPIKRSEMATLFAKALPASYYNGINAVVRIPDVVVSAPYYNDVMLLYNAGIMMGSDAYGTFNPDANIKRSEVSAIINRVAVPANRLKKALQLKSTGNGYYLSYDTGYGSYSGIPSGWSLDNRGGAPRTSEEGEIFVNDISRTEGSGVIRSLTYTDSGVVTLETSLNFLFNFDGFYLAFLDQSKNPAYKLYTENNAVYVLDAGNTPKKLFDNSGKKSYSLRIVLDFNAGTSETIIDWTSYGTTPLLSGNIKSYKLGSTDEAVVSVKQSLTNIYVDYAVNEDYSFAVSGTAPYGWTVSKSSDEVQSGAQGAEYILKTPATGGTAAGVRPFTALTDKVCYETLFFMPTLASEYTITLASGETAALEFSTKDGAFYANGKMLRSYQANMWYRLRFEIDLGAGNALIKVNGKKLDTVPLLNSIASLNTLRYKLEATDEATVRLDETKISNLVDYDDYVPEPVKPAGEEQYNIGVNVCSLWRNGTHGGWDCISPYDELKPVLGYYDEGIPEVADWEIKFMAEHGIDFQLFCWYSSVTNSPIKTTGLSAAIHDGYFNAKYSDKVKFALLWEAANAQHPAGSEAFRKFFVPYWVEYFFTDDRYMTIDNKLVIAVFGPGQLIKDFGSAEAVKAEFDYVREVAKSLGFDGAIFMACSGNTQQIKDCGFDACYAYNWGKAGYSATVTKQQITSNQEAGYVHMIPTVSTGFNNVGWAGTRSPNMSVSDYKLVNEWVRDVALKKYANASETWKKNFVMLSTWNEYGEGTYIMPAGLNGFGYLDALREVYTKGGAHEDVAPTANQLKRLGYLFPQDRAIIRPLYRKTGGELPTGVLYRWNFADSKDSDKFDGWSMTRESKQGVYAGTSTSSDPIMMMKNSEPVELGNSTHIKIRMKAPAGNSVQVFFATNAEKGWSEDKAASTSITSDAMTDYYISFKSNPKWKGTLDKLRIDPVSVSGVSFEVESIEILYPENLATISINGTEQVFNVDVVEENGYHLIPMNPEKGIFFMMNAFYEWDKANAVLTMYANHKSIVFTMGSKKALVDGKEVELPCTPYLDDGLPMIPIEYIAEVFGFKMLKGMDGSISLITMSEESLAAVGNRIDNEWEFNLTGDMEGWSFGNSAGTALDGAVIGVSNKTSDGRWDPILYSPKLSVDARQYSKIVVVMKHEINSDKPQKLGIYFTTTSLSWAQERYVGLAIAEKSSDDKYVTYEIPMSGNKDWAGIITAIRVDPFDCEGSFTIDSVKFVK